MIPFLLFAQITAFRPPTDSVFASDALRQIVTAAIVENARLSRTVPAYRALVESEFSMLSQDSIDRERPFAVQQQASTIHWHEGVLDVAVVAARPPVRLPTASVWPTDPVWLLPALYGNRIPFAFSSWLARRRDDHGAAVSDTLVFEHPFEPDAERRYHYDGGDTVAKITIAGRVVHVVHVRVAPRFAPDEAAAALDGDVYLDADRHQIVRVRGRLVRHIPEGSGGARLLRVTATTVAPFIDVENEEVGGAIWLPHTERIELQLSTAALFGSRVIWRSVATFSDFVVEPVWDSSPAAVTAVEPRVHIVYPESERSLGTPHEWLRNRGDATHSARATDFVDLAPANWRDEGPPQFSIRPSRLSRLVHVDPIEGVYTGLEGTLALRDAAPGLVARGFGGWAWAERTLRGGAGVSRQAALTTTLFAERTLESTNDFSLNADDAAPIVGEFLAFLRPSDYVDRRTVALAVSNPRRTRSDVIAALTIGANEDRPESTHLRSRVFAQPDTQLANRLAVSGTYTKATLDIEWHPDANIGAGLPGFGMRAHLEGATGGLSWERATLAVGQRREFGDWWVSQRVDLGVVASPKALPPQQLFELGGTDRLGAYAYKAFAGDRAAIGNAAGGFTFPWFRGTRLPGARALPPLSPGVNAGLEIAWTSLSSNAAASAALLTAPAGAGPVPTPTNRIRGSVGFGLTLFSGLIHVGLARAFEAASPWRPVIGVGASY